MKRHRVRIDATQGNPAAFDLVLIDGYENGEMPTNIQIEDSQEQISLARTLGCTTQDESGNPLPHPEGEHGIAYDFLKSKLGTTFVQPEGYFDAIPYGPFKHCNRCGGFHRLGYGGDCLSERWEYDGSRMQLRAPQRKFAVVQLTIAYPFWLNSEQVFDEWIRALDKLVTPSGVVPRSSKLLSVHNTDPDED